MLRWYHHGCGSIRLSRLISCDVDEAAVLYVLVANPKTESKRCMKNHDWDDWWFPAGWERIWKCEALRNLGTWQSGIPEFQVADIRRLSDFRRSQKGCQTDYSWSGTGGQILVGNLIASFDKRLPRLRVLGLSFRKLFISRLSLRDYTCQIKERVDQWQCKPS